VLDPGETRRFLDLVQRLPSLSAADLPGLNVTLPADTLETAAAHGIF